MTDHPMQPSDDQIRDWRLQAPNARDGGATREHWIARTAYAAGADAQLSACVEWNREHLGDEDAAHLRAAMRPRRLWAEQALVELDNAGHLGMVTPCSDAIIRRALERLAELEGQQDG